MADIVTQLQLRRGNRSESDAFTGAEGELTYNTEDKELRIHDGTTPGGNKISGVGKVDEVTISLNNEEKLQAIAVLDQHTGVTKTWTGTKAEYDALPEKDLQTLYYINDDFASVGVMGSNYNVGDIFYTSRLDVELNGAVECNGAEYNINDYVGFDSIGNLFTSHRIAYLSITEYNAEVAEHGVCGYFGWDEGSDTFKVPTINAVFLEAGQVGQTGTFIPAGLPNITGSFADLQYTYNGASATGAFAVQSSYARDTGLTHSGGGGATFNINASRSSSIYGNSTTVQPKSIKYRAMVQLFNGATDEAVATCTSVLADVAELKYDYVVAFQKPTADNNYTWYRKYKSGWVEQGGRTEKNVNHPSVVFPIVMANTDYHCNTTIRNDGSGTGGGFNNCSGVDNISTTGLDIDMPASANYFVLWQVSGVAAE